MILQHLSVHAVCCAKLLLILQHLSEHAVSPENKITKITIKCQPAIRDTSRGGPHTANAGVGVPDSGLTRPKQKNIRTKKLKNENESSNVTLANHDARTKVTLEVRTPDCTCGNTVKSCQLTGTTAPAPTRKALNKQMHTKNGNIAHTITVAHWNMGPAHWSKKRTEIEAFLQTVKPELFFITEANLFTKAPDHEKVFPGHKIYLPKTGKKLGYWRTVLIAKEDTQVELLEELMEEDISAIWVRVGKKSKSSLHIGSIYREHKHIAQTQPNLSGDISAQNERWNRTVNMWRKATKNARCTMLGDVNLDFLKWEAPDHEQTTMVDKTKTDIELGGNTQLIKKPTRFWSGQTPSIPDHIWTNAPDRISSTQNLKRAVSDHNAIIARISTREKTESSHETVTRVRKNFNTERFSRSIGEIDWTEYYTLTDINLINDMFCSKVLEILDREAPLKVFQPRKGYKVWVTEETKLKMTDRDKARDIAIETQDPHRWQTYRAKRNECTKMNNKDRNNHFKKIYTDIANEKDTKNLHKTTRELLGWSTGGPPKQFLVDGKMIQSPKELANTQINYYTEKLSKITQNLPANTEDPLRILKDVATTWEGRDSVNTMKFCELSDLDIVKLISDMGNSTSFGHDNLDSFSMKLAATHLYKPLKHLVNSSLKSETFANVWKLGKLIPLHKGKGCNKTDPSVHTDPSVFSQHCQR